MSEYAKNIQTIEDMWKKRIELREEGGGRMSEYTRREMEYRAEQIAYEAQKRLARMEHIVDGLGEVKGEIVRCRDCKYYRFVDRSGIFHDERHNDSFCLRFVDGKRMEVEADGFCAWGERREK